MFLTEIAQRVVPEAREQASGFGVTDGSLGPTKVRAKEIFAESVDDAGCVIGLHRGTMTNNLSSVKTTDSPLWQSSWRGKLDAVMQHDRPYGDIAERLRWHRALEGLDQKEYAERAGLQRAQLSNWESGNFRMSLDGARALRRTYGLSLDFMFEGIDDALPMTLRAAWRDRPSVK